jgi:hypothetical protein
MQENSVTKKRFPLTLHEFQKSQFLRAQSRLLVKNCWVWFIFPFDLD